MQQITTYKVTGSSDVTYYGYTNASSGDILPAFLVGATRGDDNSQERGDVRFLSENGNDITTLFVTELGVFNDELDALICRNDHRARDVSSITGPTLWPYQQRLEEKCPEVVELWKKQLNYRASKNALEAYQAGAWEYPQIKTLADQFTKDVVMEDLRSLSYQSFALKYFNKD